MQQGTDVSSRASTTLSLAAPNRACAADTSDGNCSHVTAPTTFWIQQQTIEEGNFTEYPPRCRDSTSTPRPGAHTSADLPHLLRRSTSRRLRPIPAGGLPNRLLLRPETAPAAGWESGMSGSCRAGRRASCGQGGVRTCIAAPPLQGLHPHSFHQHLWWGRGEWQKTHSKDSAPLHRDRAHPGEPCWKHLMLPFTALRQELPQ